MNINDLDKLIHDVLKSDSDFTFIQATLVHELRLKLAVVWDEGYQAGYNDGAAEQGMGWEPETDQNPYEERATSST